MEWQDSHREWVERHNAPGAVTMTPEEWQRCPLPTVMLRFLYAYPDARKRRLFAIACLHRVADSIPLRYRLFVTVAEDFVEGRADADDLKHAHDCVEWMIEGNEDLLQPGEVPLCTSDDSLTFEERRFAYGVWRVLESPACYEHPDRWQLNDAAGWVAESLSDAASYLPGQNTWDNDKMDQERTAQADLLRDIYGDPFHPVSIAPPLRTPTVAHLAQDMYERGTFDAMHTLKSALRAAGCADTHLLAHCESKHPHVRGCWLIDALLDSI